MIQHSANSFLKRYWVYLALLIVPLGLTFSWFSRGLMFAGGEEGLPFYNPTRSFELFNSLWYEAGTGYLNLGSITKVPLFFILKYFYELGVSEVILQASVFFVILVLASFSIFALFKFFLDNPFPEKAELISLIGSIFYICNPYSMNQIWGRGLVAHFIIFALIPFLLMCFVYGLEKRKIYLALLPSFVSFVFAYAFTNPAILIALWSNIGIYLLYYIIKNRQRKKLVIEAILYYLIFFGSWVLTNLFWLLPYIESSRSMIEFNLAEHDSIASLQAVSQAIPFDIVIRLLHKNSFFTDAIYGRFYSFFPITILSWTLALIAILSFKYRRMIPGFGFFVSIFAVALFICIGANPPTGWLLIWLMENFPVLQMLRNPYEKYGFNLVLPYAFFVSLGIFYVSEIIGRHWNVKYSQLKALAIMVLLICGIFVWPLWTGHFAGGFVFNPWVKVPDYYQVASHYLNHQGENFSVIQLPLNPGDGILYTWEYPFQGIDPSEFLYDKPSISRDFTANKEYYRVLLDRFGHIGVGAYFPGRAVDNSEFRGNNLVNELSKLNARFLVLRNDINDVFIGSTPLRQTKQFLATQSGIRKKETIEELDFYEVEIPKQIGLIYSPEVEVTFDKINPGHYQLNIESNDKPINLYFLQQFNTNWQLKINNQEVVEHSKVFSYANGWRVDPTIYPKNAKMEINFKPDQSYHRGMRISLTSLAIGLFYIFLFVLYKLIKRRKN